MDKAIWELASRYMSSREIDFEVMLEQEDFSSGYGVLVALAGNLFDGRGT